MTRQHNQRFDCPNCNTCVSAETLFGRWIRNNPDLDSAQGFVFVDCDYWVHRFKTYQGREFQCIMLVEVKSNGAKLSPSQRDTLHIVNQLMRNRRQTPTKKKVFETSSAPLKVRSLLQMKDVNVKSFGVHTLRFSGLGPADSERIYWDRSIITTDQLTELLRFDLDPDTLKVIDLRSHHIKNEQATLL